MPLWELQSLFSLLLFLTSLPSEMPSSFVDLVIAYSPVSESLNLLQTVLQSSNPVYPTSNSLSHIPSSLSNLIETWRLIAYLAVSFLSFFLFFFFPSFSRAVPAAYGVSQANQSCSHRPSPQPQQRGSEPSLQPTSQLTAMPDP